MGISNATKPSHPMLAYTSFLWDFLLSLFWAAFLNSYFFISASISLGKTTEGIIAFWISASLPLWVLYGWRATVLDNEEWQTYRTSGGGGYSPLFGLLAVILPAALLIEYLLLSWWSLPKLPDFIG
jgi:uncharacterized membrane-anchored protein YitT (DUF2179 family)